ncbi:hypothetical protein VTJ49DRAFT_902 [Mycothermus thermophilus]|uniref:Prion-inhibition and propagation HeLo domain-containing protein n=1 Tax=Humicola insolens TaxID=85995 RepID=A0ABR3VFY3_HUMIN
MEVAAGAISLIWDVFDNTVGVFKFLTALVDMPHEYEQYRLQLVIEYNRVLAWGKAVGLIHVPDGSLAATLGTDSIELAAILARIQRLLSEFRDLHARYGNEVRPIDVARPAKGSGTHDGTDAGESQPTDADILKGISTLAITYEANKDQRRRLRGHLRDFFRHTKDIVTHPARVWWVAVDKEAFEALLRGLHALTERLHELTRNYQARQLDAITANMYREMVLVRNDVGDLKAMLGAVSNLVSSPEGHPASDYHSYRALQDLTRLKKLSLISDNILSQILGDPTLGIGHSLDRLDLKVRQYTEADLLGAFEWNELDVENPEYLPRPRGILLRDIRVNDQNGDTSMEDGIPVWIEWKALGDAPAGSARDREAVLRTTALAEMLAQPKPAALRAPECVGFFDDRAVSGADRLAWIFRMPAGSDANTRIATLHTILGNPKFRPPLSRRVAMASALCDTILHLHAINWLHKGVFGENVVFHLNNSRNSKSASGLPYDPEKPVLSGFEYSRPDGTETTARDTDIVWDLYRWPGIQRQPPTERNSKKTYDLYSLGLVLLEIAHWEKLDRLMGLGRPDGGINARSGNSLAGVGDEVPDVPLEQSRKLRDWLLGIQPGAPFDAQGLPNPLEDLRNRVGERYWQAVSRCLWAHGERGFGVDERADQSNDSDVGLALQEAFTHPSAQ